MPPKKDGSDKGSENSKDKDNSPILNVPKKVSGTAYTQEKTQKEAMQIAMQASEQVLEKWGKLKKEHEQKKPDPKEKIRQKQQKHMIYLEGVQKSYEEALRTQKELSKEALSAQLKNILGVKDTSGKEVQQSGQDSEVNYDQRTAEELKELAQKKKSAIEQTIESARLKSSKGTVAEKKRKEELERLFKEIDSTISDNGQEEKKKPAELESVFKKESKGNKGKWVTFVDQKTDAFQTSSEELSKDKTKDKMNDSIARVSRRAGELAGQARCILTEFDLLEEHYQEKIDKSSSKYYPALEWYKWKKINQYLDKQAQVHSDFEITLTQLSQLSESDSPHDFLKALSKSYRNTIVYNMTREKISEPYDEKSLEDKLSLESIIRKESWDERKKRHNDIGKALRFLMQKIIQEQKWIGEQIVSITEDVSEEKATLQNAINERQKTLKEIFASLNTANKNIRDANINFKLQWGETEEDQNKWYQKWKEVNQDIADTPSPISHEKFSEIMSSLDMLKKEKEDIESNRVDIFNVSNLAYTRLELEYYDGSMGWNRYKLSKVLDDVRVLIDHSKNKGINVEKIEDFNKDIENAQSIYEQEEHYLEILENIQKKLIQDIELLDKEVEKQKGKDKVIKHKEQLMDQYEDMLNLQREYRKYILEQDAYNHKMENIGIYIGEIRKSIEEVSSIKEEMQSLLTHSKGTAESGNSGSDLS